MLRWVSVAPLGAPVVPLVNWMLIGIVGLRASSVMRIERGRASRRRAVAATSAKLQHPRMVRLLAQRITVSQLRQARGFQRARRGPVQLRRQLAQHAEIVATS